MVKFIVSGTFEVPRTALFKRAFRRVDLPEFMTPLTAMLKSVSFDLFFSRAKCLYEGFLAIEPACFFIYLI